MFVDFSLITQYLLLIVGFSLGVAFTLMVQQMYGLWLDGRNLFKAIRDIFRKEVKE
jgi:hypothetical protein